MIIAPIVAVAEFPGPIPDELNAAGIMCAVRTPAEHDPHDHVLDATTFRAELADPQPREDLARITIQPLDDGTAAYSIDHRTSTRIKVVYAEYPGHIVDEINAAGVPITMVR